MSTSTATLPAWRRRFLAPSLGFPRWARDAPDRLVYTSNVSGKVEVYAWDRTAGEHRRLTDRPEGTGGAFLDPSGEHAWWFDDDRGSEFGIWRRQPFRGGDAEPATTLPPAYPAGLLLGTELAVVGSSTEAGASIHVVRPGARPVLIYSHREDAAPAALSRDGSLVAVEHSERGDSRNPAVRVLDLTGRRVGEIDEGPGRGVEARAWSPVPGDQRLLVGHEPDGLSRPALWSAAAGTLEEVELDLPGEVAATWYPDGRALLVTHSHRGRDELHRLDLETRALTRLPFPPGTIAAARVRPDGEVWAWWTDAATAHQVRSAEGVVVGPPGEPAPGGVPYQDLEARGVHAFLAEPAAPRPHPTVFLVHGGPASHVVDAFSPGVQAWVDHGFAVVMVNYRGSTGYGKSWRDAIEGNPGLTELEDVAALHDLVVREGIAEPGRIALYGRSWGGYLTLLGLGTQPERWACGLAGVPVADYLAAYEDEMEPLKAYDAALFGGTPETKPGLYRERSPLTYVEDVRAPVLILAGLNDPRCPIRQIENYVRRLEELGKPHQVHRYEAGHASLKIAEVVRQQELLLDFCARHLGTPPPA